MDCFKVVFNAYFLSSSAFAGMYIYIDSTYLRPGVKVAGLTSPVLPPTTNHTACFSFWYYMFGNQAGELHLSYEMMKNSTDILGSTSELTRQSHFIDRWYHYSFDVREYGTNFMVRR